MNSNDLNNLGASSGGRESGSFAWPLRTLEDVAAEKTRSEVFATLLGEATERFGGSQAVLVEQRGREWDVIAAAPRGTALANALLPRDVIAEAVDRGQTVRTGRMTVVPMDASFPMPSDKETFFPPLVLVIADGEQKGDKAEAVAGAKYSDSSRIGSFEDGRRQTGATSGDAVRAAQCVAQGVHAFQVLVLRQQNLRGRNRRLETLLRIAASWSEFDDCEKLLETIAGSAARLLEAERASIFLWDRPRRKLVGRPALGVEGNRLEVPDSEGIVGAVLHSGRPKRWHHREDAEGEVNRKVDRTLSFQTHSLLAVPLWGNVDSSDSVALFKGQALFKESVGLDPEPAKATTRRQRTQNAGQAIGVFELINRKEGAFTEDDEEALTELAILAAAAIRNTQSRQSLIEDREHLVAEAAAGVQVIGDHDSIVAVRASATRVAKTDLSVLILGENGTGKEVLARSIHYESARRHHPFVAVNCAAIVESLLESELFGHEKGAFTDAQQARQGKFELASGGTIFLDEIGDLSPGGQAKLLRVLEERKVYRVGGSQMIDVDVRVIAATNQPLAQMVQTKRFREDLFFRLNTVTLKLPPLRERGNDIETLAHFFLHQFSRAMGRKLPEFSPQARETLKRYHWPGNIRELRNLVERVTYLCPHAVIEAEELGLEFDLNPRYAGQVRMDSTDLRSGDRSADDLAEATRLFQVQHIEQAIARCQGNMTEAAESLGLHRSNLYRKMRQLGMVDG